MRLNLVVKNFGVQIDRKRICSNIYRGQLGGKFAYHQAGPNKGHIRAHFETHSLRKRE